jgi:hypothetical protein
MVKFDGLQVFSATMHNDRAVLGEKVTEWITNNKPHVGIVDIEVHQSSDDAFHCITIIVYYRHKVAVLVGQQRSAAAGAKRG